MKRRLEEVVVEALSFSPAKPSFHSLTGYSPRQWNRCLTWMDDTGLALYFLKSVEQTTDDIPDFVVQRLQNKRRANLGRTAYMERQFHCINRRFEEAGLRYAAVKGLTLVPVFCPDASSRHQSDFDYLVEHTSLDSASRLLEEMGYLIFKTFDDERIFTLPSRTLAVRGDTQYAASAPHSIELHLTIGHFAELAWKEPSFLDNAITRRFQGSEFHGLSDDDSFVLQAIHAFHHLLDGWMKLSWLYEIGYFVDSHILDNELWCRVSAKLSGDPLLREAVAVIVSLAAQIFQAHIPVAIGEWIEQIRTPVITWIENYARVWAFGRTRVAEFEWFPPHKLVLFLHQKYVPDKRSWRAIAASRLLAVKGLKRISRSVAAASSPGKTNARLSTQEFRRIAFHLGSGIRYMWELPRWWHLKRTYSPIESSFRTYRRPSG